MGRGRQKAKHTKLARELKYSEIETDYNALQAELAGKPATTGYTPSEPEEDEEDEYSKLAAKYEVTEEDEA